MKYEAIKNNRDFVRAYKKGKKAVSNLIVLYKIKNDGNEKRIGITVSKKVGKAVTRNRVKRLIREAVYLNYKKLTDGYDYVFVARVRAADAEYKDLISNANYAVNKIQNMKK
ncbi:MAG: ribonuclease P protein component [Bacillota bacterium]|nr:ribonuclease P protein component [Bacillota bacterium]